MWHACLQELKALERSIMDDLREQYKGRAANANFDFVAMKMRTDPTWWKNKWHWQHKPFRTGASTSGAAVAAALAAAAAVPSAGGSNAGACVKCNVPVCVEHVRACSWEAACHSAARCGDSNACSN